METKLKYAVEGTLLRIELNGDYLEYDDDEVVRRLYEAAESAGGPQTVRFRRLKVTFILPIIAGHDLIEKSPAKGDLLQWCTLVIVMQNGCYDDASAFTL